ncbi:MAG: AAA family ATPase [Candidatus Micrarchaeia archaeon]
MISRQGGVIAVIGGPGGGKSSLLRHFRHVAEKQGMLSVMVKAEKGEDERSVVDKLYSEMAFPPGAKPEAGAPHDLEGLVRALDRADKKAFGAIVFIDDIDRMRKSPEFVRKIVASSLSNWGKRQIGFVISSTKELRGGSDRMTLMRLAPFGAHEAAEMMERALKKGPPKMGEECLSSILSDSGGNPRLIKSVCRHIYDKLRDNEKVITKGHYLGYFQHIMSMLSSEWFGRMYQETPGAEREILRELARNEGGMHVSDIAKKLGKPLGPVTALTKRLLDSGQIIRMDRGKYAVFARIYGRYVGLRS